MSEIWKSVEDFDGYEISDRGRVRSWRSSGRGGTLFAPRLRKLVPDKDGYLTVILRRDNKNFCAKVATLVALAFVGPRCSGQEIRHLDGHKRNNVPSNLKWGSKPEQFADQVRHGTDTRGERNGNAKLSNGDAEQIRYLLAEGYTGDSLARSFKVSPATITRIKKRQRYANAV